MSDEIVKTNNDISLFKKIVFVDNIPTESDAKTLSTLYPFAVFITKDNYYDSDGTGTGLYGRDGIDPIENPRGVSSNIWKNGKRLTKFINVDYKNNTVSLDTFSISLHFDPESGLISLSKDTKINSANIIGLTYINNYVSSREHLVSTHYLNRKLIKTENFNVLAMNAYENLTRNVRDLYLTNENDNDEMPIFKLINSSDDINKLDIIDAKYNKFYIIVQYTAINESALRNVSSDTFKISLNKGGLFNITNYWDLNNLDKDRLINEKIRIGTFNKYNNPLNSTTPYYNDLELIKYYCNLANSSARYIVYEVEIKTTIDDIGKSGFNITNYDCNFTYESLVDNGFNNKFQLQFNNVYVNPTSFKLYVKDTNASKGNREELITYNIDANNNVIIPDYYLYPGELAECRLIPYREIINNGANEETTLGIRTDLNLSFLGDNLFKNNIGFKVYDPLRDINNNNFEDKYNNNCDNISLSATSIPEFKFRIKCSENYPEITEANIDNYQNYFAELKFIVRNNINYASESENDKGYFYNEYSEFLNPSQGINNYDFYYLDACPPVTLNQYKFDNLDVTFDFEGIKTVSNLLKSGRQIGYCIRSISLTFKDPISGNIEPYTLSPEELSNGNIELRISLQYPGKKIEDNNYTQLKKCFEISDNPTSHLYFKYIGGDAEIVTDYTYNDIKRFFIPWLSPEAPVAEKDDEKPRLNFICKYKGKSVTFCTIDIESDDLVSIETNTYLTLENSGVIDGNLNTYFTIHHKTTGNDDNPFVKFIYSQDQIIDGWKWFYSKNINDINTGNRLVKEIENKYYFNDDYIIFTGDISSEDTISYDKNSNPNDIIYNLKVDTRKNKTFKVQLKYGNKVSNELNIEIAKHEIHWYMYIGCMDYDKRVSNDVVDLTIRNLTYYKDSYISLPYSDATGGFPNNEQQNQIIFSRWEGTPKYEYYEDLGSGINYYDGGWIDLGTDLNKYVNNNDIILSISSGIDIKTKCYGTENKNMILLILPYFVDIDDGTGQVPLAWVKQDNIEINNGKYKVWAVEEYLHGYEIFIRYNFIIKRSSINDL